MSSPPDPPKPNDDAAPPPSVRTPAPAPVVEVVGPEAQAAPTAAAPIEDPPSISLHHSRAPSRRHAWLRIALPLVGLSLVPAVGLIYAATASFGKAEEEGEEAAGASVDGGAAKKGKIKPKAAKGAPKPRTDGAAECCAKLRELGKTAPLDARASYLSAAQACEAAPDEDRALKVAKSNVQTAKHELPEECAP